MHIAFKHIMPKKNNRKKRTPKRQAAAAMPKGNGLDNLALRYRNLLRDPCGAPMVPPIGPGPTSGLLVRQRYYDTLDRGASISTGDFVAVLIPAKGILRSTTSGQNNFKETDLETGILGSSICRAYRCVAACMKWIPTGDVMNRSGMIQTGYALDEVDSTTPVTANNLSNWQALCPKTVSNTGMGSDIEVRWVPSGPEDVEFRSRGVTYNADTGTCLMVGKDIDFKSGATSYAKGVIEVTIVWEWLPTNGAGVVTPLQVGSRSTMQQMLSTIGNLTSFVLDSPMGRAAGRNLMQRAVDYVAGAPLLTY